MSRCFSVLLDEPDNFVGPQRDDQATPLASPSKQTVTITLSVLAPGWGGSGIRDPGSGGVCWGSGLWDQGSGVFSEGNQVT